MKNKCFVDSVGWIALLNAADELHQKTDSIYKQMLKSGTLVLTSTAILNEVANSLCQPKFRNSVVELYKTIKNSNRVDVIFVNKNLWSTGWGLFENRPDKSWSLTDCSISMEIMKKYGLIEVLTNDKHFAQAGFKALLRNG